MATSSRRIFKGPIRVSEAFLELIEDKGRIVNVVGRRVVVGAPAGRGHQEVLLGPDISKEALVADVAKQAAGAEGGWPGTRLSKAGLTAYTMYRLKPIRT